METISEKVFCCGESMIAKQVYDPETKKDSFLFVCQCCSAAKEIKASKDEMVFVHFFLSKPQQI